MFNLSKKGVRCVEQPAVLLRKPSRSVKAFAPDKRANCPVGEPERRKTVPDRLEVNPNSYLIANYVHTYDSHGISIRPAVLFDPLDHEFSFMVS